jgi:polyhydroxyalkanoate synthesis regulator phasin
MGKKTTVNASAKKSSTSNQISEKIKKLAGNVKSKATSVVEECVDYVEAFIAIARNYVENYPGKEQVDERVDRIIKSVASKINLPTREDAEELSVSIDLLNRRLEAILKK